MHINIGPERTAKLEDFKKRVPDNNKSAVIRDALDLLFAISFPDETRDVAVKVAVDHYFSPPKVLPPQTLFTILHLLAARYPEESSRKFWGPMMYRSGIDKTHREIYAEVSDHVFRTVKELESQT